MNISQSSSDIRFKEVLVSSKLTDYDFLSGIQARRIRRVDPELLYHIAYHSRPIPGTSNSNDDGMDEEILENASIGDSLMVATLPRPVHDFPEKITLALCLNDVIFPDNVGSLLQSAHAIGGVDVVIGTEKTCDFYGWKVLEACKGLGYNIPKRTLSEPEQVQAFIRDNNLLPIVGDCSEGVPLSSLDVSKYSGVFVIVGNEKHGPTQAMRDMAVKIRIPIKIHSLNVGVAGGILLQQAKSVFPPRASF